MLLHHSSTFSLRRNSGCAASGQPARLSANPVSGQLDQQLEQPFEHRPEPDTGSAALFRVYVAPPLCNTNRPSISAISVHQCTDLPVQIQCTGGTRLAVRFSVSSVESSSGPFGRTVGQFWPSEWSAEAPD